MLMLQYYRLFDRLDYFTVDHNIVISARFYEVVSF